MTSSSGTPDARPGREPESATFETVRVPARRGSGLLSILGFLVVVGAFAAVGVGGRSVTQPTFPPVALDSPAVTSEPTVEATAAHMLPAMRVPIVPPRTFTSGPGPIQLQATRSAHSVFVHGDVFVPRTTWVYLSLRDQAGNVAGWASVSVPGSAGPAQGTGPNVRFDVELALPEGFAEVVWVNASAYNADSAVIASARLAISPLVLSRIEFEP